MYKVYFLITSQNPFFTYYLDYISKEKDIKEINTIIIRDFYNNRLVPESYRQ